MKFEVPQYIEMEDNIFGPLSFKEFAYLIGGGGLSFILYRFIPSLIIAIILILPVLGFALALAFYKPNNKPFIERVQSAIIYFLGNKLYIWHKSTPLVVTGKENDGAADNMNSLLTIPKINQNKLTDMSFNLATQGKKKGVGDAGIRLKV